ncbi:hypothetical protein C8Q80DRAFT_1160293 [Daedaleopsis nitida]|nr:hypothetical protein C8Q80DRAFT_1160293 [Daedaleopsis nitida]
MYELDVGAGGLGAGLLGAGSEGASEQRASEDVDGHEALGDRTNSGRLDELGRAIEEMWTWQVREQVRTQWEEAERKFDELVRRRGGRGRDDAGARDAANGKGERGTREVGRKLWKGCVVM